MLDMQIVDNPSEGISVCSIKEISKEFQRYAPETRLLVSQLFILLWDM